MKLLFVRIILSVVIVPLLASGRSNNFEENDIIQFLQPKAEDKFIPLCTANSACAFLQVNAQGVNVQQLCSCQGASRCPLVWDSEDGRSVTQGSDQYKYCRKAPELEACQHGMTAFTTTRTYSKKTGDLLVLNNVLHCLCSGNSNYEKIDDDMDLDKKQDYGEEFDQEFENMEMSYTCLPLKPCDASEPCKVVSETSSDYLVNPKCRCPHDKACPSVVSGRNSRRFLVTQQFGKGRINNIYCH